MRIFRCSRYLLLALCLIAVPASMCASVFISVGFAPPPLPVYQQPPCPSEGYIWTPGYWAYGPYGYYWVPGTWVEAPQPGYLWTPGWWGFENEAYIWHGGYWGPQVGYYGGIPYGYGYNGVGYQGGYWQGQQFYYNRAVNNVNITNIHNTYVTNVTNVNENRVSYNGPGGIQARPSAAQERIMAERHVAATSAQLQHERMASQDESLRATVNHGRPQVAATARPAEFHGAGVVGARNAPVNTAATQPHGNAARPNETRGETAARTNNVPRPTEPRTPEMARPTNNTARPTESRDNTAARPNNVPRPPEHRTETAPARPTSSVPRPTETRRNENTMARPSAPRPAEPRENTAARPSTPRPA